ncbi:chemoreceptor glutamine deamidase CheD [Salinisphaera sp. Q1T1-3]|uniref:chemoreceptor glutamine deamidase CheD n=1 Tax=Salinisphaera sp. Q1T1-3 TaxID=2321229 RepID=UPI000E74CCE4|nr:chemoreceptor glutamine deamidase CheD [Salinisphaera sp. Q1T1-3]RJS95184.1 chemoreceptor glutamine deamidase CheD [Salinisphaera sp. Q1T1-3]
MTAVDIDLASRQYVGEHGETHIKLLPKEYYVTDQPFVLTTVLGSCVAVCLRDSGTGMAGMNHFMLPDTTVDDAAQSMVYGRHATQRLVDALLARGARQAGLEAKIFGGANVLTDMRHARIGALNAEFARTFLAEARIPIRAEDLGGVWPRQLQYHAGTGIARVRCLRGVTSELAARERHLARAVSETVSGATT